VFTLVVFLNVTSFLYCHDVITHETQHCTTRFGSRIIQTPLLFGHLALGTNIFLQYLPSSSVQLEYNGWKRQEISISAYYFKLI